MEKLFGKKVGVVIAILCGGSVKPDHVAEITAEKDVDGVLVGGASLDAKTLAEIIHNIGGSPAPKKRKPRVKKEKDE